MTKVSLITVALSTLFAIAAAITNESAAGPAAFDNAARSPAMRGSRDLQDVTPAPTAEDSYPPTSAPTSAPTTVQREYNVLANDDDSGAKDDGSGYVEVGTQTTVLVYARAWDDRPGEASGNVGCGEDGQRGCMPALTRDGDTMDEESRWSCAKKISYDQCWITFAFEEPQYVHDIEVYLWKGDERKRTLKVTTDGNKLGEFDSQPGSVTTSIDINKEHVSTLTLESLDLDTDEWLSVIEVRINVGAVVKA